MIPGVSRANGVSAAIGDSRGFLPIGGRDRTLAVHNLFLYMLHGACPELALGSYLQEMKHSNAIPLRTESYF